MSQQLLLGMINDPTRCNHGSRIRDNDICRIGVKRIHQVVCEYMARNPDPFLASVNAVNLHENLNRNEDFTEKITASIIALAADCLILEKDSSGSGFAAAFAAIAIQLEHEHDNEEVRIMKGRDMSEGGRRVLSKYLSKRIPCKCLREIYKDSRTEEKLGICHKCEVAMDRNKLMTCSGCRGFRYCSVKCQRADWPTHKAGCAELSNIFRKMQIEV